MRVPQNVLKLIMNSKNPGYHFSVQHLVHIKMLGPSCCPSQGYLYLFKETANMRTSKKIFFLRCGEIYLGRRDVGKYIWAEGPFFTLSTSST